MKKICKYLLAACFLVAGVLAISSCREKEPLKTPENLRIEDEILSWDPVEHASGYCILANDMEFRSEGASFDLLDTVIEPDTYTVCVTAVGGSAYSDSERSEGIEYVVQSTDGMFKVNTPEDGSGDFLAPVNRDALVGKLVIPKSYNGEAVTRIAHFWNCNNLTAVYIPDSVVFIGGCFTKCSNLKRIEVAAENPVYRSEGNCVIRKEDNAVVNGCKTSVIPQGVKAIGDRAFAYLDSVASIEIPNSVTKIDMYTFYECTGLTTITIPDSVTEIGNLAFYGCTSLTELTLGDGLTTIGRQAFLGCSRLSAVTIPSSVQSIEKEAFWYCYACFIVPASLKEFLGEFNGGTVYTDAEVNSGDIIWSSTIYGCQFGYDGAYPYVISWEYKLLPSLIPGYFRKMDINAEGTQVPVRAGYEFLGWATEEGGEVVYAPQDIIVKFESSGGRSSGPTTVIRKVWRVAIYGEEEFNSLALGTVLYAVWRPLK